MNIRKVFFVIAAAFLTLSAPLSSGAEESKLSTPKLVIFISPVCHRCIEVKSDLLPKIEKEFGGIAAIEYRDTSDIENYKQMIALRDKYRPELKISMPVFYMGGKFLTGEDDLDRVLRGFIRDGLSAGFKDEGRLPGVDLVAYFKSFTPLAVVAAGLIDGINPCAFTVIVFFISFLALQGYKKRELVAIGLTFIFAVFVTYVLLGVGLFGFLYQLRHFWLVVRIFNFSIGVFSVSLGVLALYDLFKFNKTGKTEGLILQLPPAIKSRIHQVIGLHYRKTERAQSETGSSRQHIVRLVISALITGFLVSILEAVCTGQTYLPTIAFIMKTTELKAAALKFLLVYNVMFILPLFVIFLAALFGVTSKQFSDFLKEHMGVIKALMALLFFGLGIFLLWRR